MSEIIGGRRLTLADERTVRLRRLSYQSETTRKIAETKCEFGQTQTHPVTVLSHVCLAPLSVYPPTSHIRRGVWSWQQTRELTTPTMQTELVPETANIGNIGTSDTVYLRPSETLYRSCHFLTSVLFRSRVSLTCGTYSLSQTTSSVVRRDVTGV